jgi:hypothetical protein
MITSEGRDGQIARGRRRGASRRAVAVAGGLSCLPDCRADELFELADAVLCADGPVKTLAALSLGAVPQRRHGALYDAVNCGEIAIGRLRQSLAGLPLPRAASDTYTEGGNSAVTAASKHGMGG